MVDVLWHLYLRIPGLYQDGLSANTVARLIAPKQGTRNAYYHGVVEARVDMKRNDSGATGRMVPFGRSENRKLREWHSYWQQLNGSGDDMNIIQAGV